MAFLGFAREDVTYLQSLNHCYCDEFTLTPLLSEEAVAVTGRFSQSFHNSCSAKHHRFYFSCPCKLLQAVLTGGYHGCTDCEKVCEELFDEALDLQLSQTRLAASALAAPTDPATENHD